MMLFIHFSHLSIELGNHVIYRNFRPFLKLIKHGIILGNLVPVIAGYLLALNLAENFNVSRFIATIIGISAIIASATIANNIIDRDIDRIMTRTQNRPLVNGDISLKTALILSIIAAIIGFYLLFVEVNRLAGFFALIGFIDYILLYSLIFKRNSTLSILVGSISGAVPPLVGYVAVSNQIDNNILFLFIIFATWQVAHSYAIALYRKKDYQSAKIPMAPLFLSLKRTQKEMALYVGAMAVATLLLALESFHFLAMQILIIAITLYWLIDILRPIQIEESHWGRRQFLNSLLLIMAFCFTIMIDYLFTHLINVTL